MSLRLSIRALFTSFMQSVNGAQFLNTASLPALFELPNACSAAVIVPLTIMYASLKSHKLDFNNQILNLI